MKLKSWPHFFQAIKAGTKTHDLRSKKDREFHVGQVITLREYDPFEAHYTGEEIEVVVSFITDDKTPCALSSAVLEKGYVILSIQVVKNG
jgi:ASC-1-like (ASCH) protein